MVAKSACSMESLLDYLLAKLLVHSQVVQSAEMTVATLDYSMAYQLDEKMVEMKVDSMGGKLVDC